ncbi:hypothetical protein OF83DRAFT_1174816 [Amylostereum chailletii]|nr:hypothetical protein OF83DRAFT_1174816 [Amylostereum chailletii]
MEKKFRSQILEPVTAIHEVGIVHNKLNEDNVLDYHGRPIIIDFACSDDEKCKRAMAVREGDIQPTKQKFNCEELYYFCLGKLDVWKPAQVCMDGQYHLIKMQGAHFLQLNTILFKRAYPGAWEQIREHYASHVDKILAIRASALTAIHEVGIVHNKLNEDNVLDYHGRPIIIDFACSDDEKCKRAMAVREGDIQPTKQKFNCEELYYFCLGKLDVWKPAQVCMDGQYHLIKMQGAHFLQLNTILFKRAYPGAWEQIREHYASHVDKILAIRASARTL